MNEIEIINQINESMNKIAKSIEELNKLGYHAYVAEVSMYGDKKLATLRGIDDLKQKYDDNNILVNYCTEDNEEEDYHIRKLVADQLTIYQFGNRYADQIVYKRKLKKGDC